MSDAINPDHYKRLPAEAIEIIEAMIAGAPDNKAAYLHGQGAKYDLRLWRKGKSLEDYLTDWQKHIWYALRLESHLLELIEKQKSDEQQKASDIQSLKDHPFGKLRQPKWTPKVGDWVRIKKPADTIASASSWWPSMDKYDGQIIQVKQIEEDGVVLEEWGFMFDWLEPAEQPAIKQPLNTEPPDGWRFLEVGELIRNGDKPVNGVAIPLLWIGTPCCGEEFILRRNRFEVGEKVVWITDDTVCTYMSEINDGPNHPKSAWVKRDGTSLRACVNNLSPYIEDAK